MISGYAKSQKYFKGLILTLPDINLSSSAFKCQEVTKNGSKVCTVNIIAFLGIFFTFIRINYSRETNTDESLHLKQKRMKKIRALIFMLIIFQNNFLRSWLIVRILTTRLMIIKQINWLLNDLKHYLNSSTIIASTIMEDEFPTARNTGSVVAQGDNAGTRTSPATAIFSMGWLWEWLWPPLPDKNNKT